MEFKVCMRRDPEGEKKRGRPGSELWVSSGFPGGMEEMACAFLMQVTEMKDADVSLRTSPLLTFHE